MASKPPLHALERRPAFFSLLILAVFAPVAFTYPQGAPVSVCDTMTPHHGDYVPQTSTPPYTITVSTTKVDAGGTVTVTISSDSGQQFKGFLLKAVPVDSNSGAAGAFSPQANNPVYKTLSCYDQPQSAITHDSADLKSSVQATWTAPVFSGTFQFLVTVVKDGKTFWTLIKSPDTITVTGGVSTYSAAVPTLSQPSYFKYNYEECAATRSCLGYPNDCVSMQACSYLLTFRPSPDGNSVHFEMISKAMMNNYVAMGLSTDRNMGDDSVLECMVNSEGVNLQASANTVGRKNVKVNPDPRLFTAQNLSYVDGVLRCSFSRNMNTTVVDIMTDMKKNKYYILLVTGPLNGDNTDIGYHTSKISSNDLIDLPSSNFLIVFGGDRPVPIEIVIHGAFMVVAWIGTAAVAIFLARYYKDMWPEKTHCNVKIWFAWHRGLNVLTLLLTIAAYILIFVSIGISGLWLHNPIHPILGTITFILMILQPLGALFRPDPGTSRRPIFNWLHYLGGMFASICGVITIFFAVPIMTAQLPTYFWWILIAYVGFYFVMFCVMEFAGMIRVRKSEKEIIPMKDVNSHDGSFHVINQTESQGARFKEVMLLLFIAGVVGFTAALVAIIAT